ncbi:PepSY domain-containing protein [Ruegeria atlantica]|uniref:PepSY domain-containing protein n=1 Tax=Ruegeria atlantica TaxID=81569 RepID=UPI00147BEE5F|nr:hypothetical protein [Ruegeria atlantica]
MKKLLVITCLVVLVSLLQAEEGHAVVREMKQAELRKATTSGNAIRLNRVIEGVKKYFGGTPVDARAFQTDKVYYRILVKKPNGKIISVIVNAQTGVVVSNRSNIGRQISNAAKATPGNSANAASQAKANNSNNQGGNGNRGNNGRGGGNKGGNGNGNSGGGNGGGGNGNGGGGNGNGGGGNGNGGGGNGNGGGGNGNGGGGNGNGKGGGKK